MSSTILLIASARVPGTPSHSTDCFQSLSCSCEAAGLPATMGTGRWSQASLPNPGSEGGGLWGSRLLSTVPLLPGAKLVIVSPSRMARVSLTLCRPLSLSRSTPAPWDGQSGSRSPPSCMAQKHFAPGLPGRKDKRTESPPCPGKSWASTPVQGSRKETHSLKPNYTAY